VIVIVSSGELDVRHYGVRITKKGKNYCEWILIKIGEDTQVCIVEKRTCGWHS
jgi:hypothetical protein